MEDDEQLREAISIVFRNLEVAKNQHKDLWDKLLQVYPYLEPETYDSQNHWYLNVPEPTEEADLQLAIRYLNRYKTLLNHMITERSDENWNRSLVEAKEQVDTLAAVLQNTMMLIEGRIGSLDEVDSVLPEDLKNSGRSARKRRDCLFVKDYQKLLFFIETTITRFAQ